MPTPCGYNLSIPTIDIPYLVEKYRERLGLNCKRRRGPDKTYYDFTSASSQYDITEVIVEEYFGIPGYALSRKNLCPRITNRMEYLRILEHSLMETIEVYYKWKADNDLDDVAEERWIVDIGTGSSVIYPIIGSTMCVKNRFIATEIDQDSINYAKEQILPKLNVRLVEVEDAKVVLPIDNIIHNMPCDQKVRYTVCNPPFYSDGKELLLLETLKQTPKSRELVLAATEMYYTGGEVEFIKRLIDQSIELNKLPQFDNCWYSSQIGIHSHIAEIIDYCHLKGITNTFQASINFATRRWIIAWNFNDNFIPVALDPPCTTSIDSKPIRGKLDQFKSFDKFHFDIYSISNNLYLVCNEVIWLRKIKRRAQRGDDSTLFQKMIILRINTHGIELAYNNSNIDKVTIANSSVAHFA